MIYIIAMILHFLFDWIYQPRKIAKEKGTSIDALINHLYLNIIPLYVIMVIILNGIYDITSDEAGIFLLVNIGTHFLIDWFLPKGDTERQMINWTAVDQILHLSILFGTITYLT